MSSGTRTSTATDSLEADRSEAGGESVEELSGEELLLDADSDRTPMLSVVMPTLNEEGGIAECIDWVKNALETMQITGEVVVSDSSTDRTPEIAREEGAVVVTPDEPGYGYAYRYAFERSCPSCTTTSPTATRTSRWVRGWRVRSKTAPCRRSTSTWATRC
jgi:hypothetical protein